jgi:cytochrome c-type biogenesis protein CcmH
MRITRNVFQRGLLRGHQCWAVVLLFASALLLMGAAGDRTGQRFDRLGHNLMCECGCGQILLECNHVGCSTSEQMRKELKLALDRGDSDDVVLAGFVSKYGPAVLAAPTTTGFNRVAWIMPVVIFFAALTAVVLFIRAWRRSPAPPSDSTGSGSTPGELDEFRRRAREETSEETS